MKRKLPSNDELTTSFIALLESHWEDGGVLSEAEQGRLFRTVSNIRNRLMRAQEKIQEIEDTLTAFEDSPASSDVLEAIKSIAQIIQAVNNASRNIKKAQKSTKEFRRNRR